MNNTMSNTMTPLITHPAPPFFMPERLSSPIRSDVLAMHRYVVQSADELIKLDAMENPYPLPASLHAELGQVLANVALNRYPTGHQTTIDAIRCAQQIPSTYDIMLGNGSDEILHLLIQACAQDGAVIMAPIPGFVMYAISAQLNRCTFVGVPLKPDFSLDLTAMLTAITQHQPVILFLANPNNPTGNAWSSSDIEACIAAMQVHGGLVVIDEAYQPFADSSWLPRLGESPNVVLVRTLSKLGLAGLRLGYLVASPAWIEQFDKVRPPYNINVLTLAAAQCVLAHSAVLNEQAASIKHERTRLLKALESRVGVKPYPSEANFVLVQVPDANRWFIALKARGILVKNVSVMHALLHNCLRLTVGSHAENVALITALNTLT
jgi:histidinol-phosphate aminotransferase